MAKATPSDGSSESQNPPEAYLYLEAGEQIYRVALDHGRILLGSGADNDVVIRDEDVAPRAAAVTWNGRYFEIMTLALDRAPPSVNGQGVARARRLTNGDVINIEGNALRFVQVPEVSDSVIQLGICGASEYPWFALIDVPSFRIGHTVGELLLADEFIGDPHCEIENMCPGAMYLVNHDSRRGTRVNGKQVGARRRLYDGDVIKLGTTKIVVRVHQDSLLPHPDELIPLPSGLRTIKTRGRRVEVDTDKVPVFGGRAEVEDAPTEPLPEMAPVTERRGAQRTAPVKERRGIQEMVTEESIPAVSDDDLPPAFFSPQPSDTERDIQITSGVSEVRPSNETMVMPEEEARAAHREARQERERLANKRSGPSRIEPAPGRRSRPQDTPVDQPDPVYTSESETRVDLPLVKPKRTRPKSKPKP